MFHPRWAAALTGLLLVAGCGGDPEASEGAPLTPPSIAPASALPQVTDGAARALPLMAYRYSTEQFATLVRADGLIIQQCMRRLGFASWQPPAPPAATKDWSTGLPLGIVDAAQAAQYGYHSPEAVRKPVERRTASSQERLERAVLLGDSEFGDLTGKDVPEGGCQGESTRKLREGAPKADLELESRLADQAGKATQADARVTGALTAWSECMTAAGHRYRTPMEAAGQEWAATPTAAERAIAVADVQCKEKTKLAELWFGVQTGYENQLIAKNRTALDAGRAVLEAEIKRAGELLASGG
ncbi:hypothetical protein GCM10010112_61360 [Actinoplanes lobatus]|uniref:Uncharacterized protein n=1 Tax=Actinoplanes lobatus TaxID=113568 RepID=A0A7W7H8R9_9ACTN|nr:hypothetical protein [Actinoplanes lobatus]MBB4745991.1 hypothetical protein [Actinoplanes lobatus]GGN83233.1 hypothetical protein GCM10010112_61360 [Actinoplanes lobatus]GIE42326.1 hypothetical protein Alo02nite_52240 [Actinoplanes lobatus]